MPIINGEYVSPTWVDESVPAIDANELNDMSRTIEQNQHVADAKIGDVRFGDSSSWDGTWLPCDGTIINKTAYPELWDMTSAPTPKNANIVLQKNKHNTSIFYINGKYIYFYNEGIGSGQYRGCISESTDGINYTTVFQRNGIYFSTHNRSKIYDGENLIAISHTPATSIIYFYLINLNDYSITPIFDTITDSTTEAMVFYVNGKYITSVQNQMKMRVYDSIASKTPEIYTYVSQDNNKDIAEIVFFNDYIVYRISSMIYSLDTKTSQWKNICSTVLRGEKNMFVSGEKLYITAQGDYQLYFTFSTYDQSFTKGEDIVLNCPTPTYTYGYGDYIYTFCPIPTASLNTKYFNINDMVCHDLSILDIKYGSGVSPIFNNVGCESPLISISAGVVYNVYIDLTTKTTPVIESYGVTPMIKAK